MNKVGGEGKEEGDDKHKVVLVSAHFVKASEGVVREEVGDRDLRVKNEVKSGSLDVVGEDRDEACGDSGA